jgi:recombining binding protein (suppressor of hairless)
MHRYASLGGHHSIVIVDMPEVSDVVKALQEDAAIAASEGHPTDISHPSAKRDGDLTGVPAKGETRPPPVTGGALPLLFIRSFDGVGYHSGRTIAVENMFAQMEMNPHAGPPAGVDAAWLAAAQAAAGGPGGMGWSLRVL